MKVSFSFKPNSISFSPVFIDGLFPLRRIEMSGSMTNKFGECRIILEAEPQVIEKIFTERPAEFLLTLEDVP